MSATHFKIVHSFEELINTPFKDGLNALCWKRELSGDFDEVVRVLGHGEDVITLDDDILRSLNVSESGKVAIDVLIRDQALLRDAGLAPIIDLIHHYPRDTAESPVCTDVFSWHADSATCQADTYLCSYNLVSSEGIPNEHVMKKIEIPEIRAQLLESYDGVDDLGFAEFLEENFYNLHYQPLPEAKPYVFGIGNLWRIAVDWQGSPVLPCIHRAPQTFPGQPPRLLLIS